LILYNFKVKISSKSYRFLITLILELPLTT